MPRRLERTLEEKIVFAAQYMMPGSRWTPVDLTKTNIPWEGELSLPSSYVFAAIAEAKGVKKLVTVHIPHPVALTDVKSFLEWVHAMVEDMKLSIGKEKPIIIH